MLTRDDPGFDKAFKIRPILDRLRNIFQTVPKEEHLCVDEQIIPTKARTSLKQYNPAKPHKWGYKIWALCGRSGFNYDFELYGGKDIAPQSLHDEPNLGSCANTVVRLARTIPPHVNHKLFFDNFFTTVPLLVYLYKKGIPAIGTVRIVRIKNHNLISPKMFAKSDRGTVQERVAKIDGADLYLVQWNDNRIVSTISTFVGQYPAEPVTRFQRKSKSYIEKNRPKSIGCYNESMGGVDRMDSLLGYYRIQLRSKKWYIKVFFHLMDMIAVNSWTLQKLLRPEDEVTPLYYFKTILAEQLLLTNQSVRKIDDGPITTPQRRRGRPSSAANSNPNSPGPSTPKRFKRSYYIPAASTICDGVEHLPKIKTERNICGVEGCTFRSQVYCVKCKVSLCLNSHRNCFLSFHCQEE